MARPSWSFWPCSSLCLRGCLGPEHLQRGSNHESFTSCCHPCCAVAVGGHRPFVFFLLLPFPGRFIGIDEYHRGDGHHDFDGFCGLNQFWALRGYWDLLVLLSLGT